MSNEDKRARNEELPVSQRDAEPTGAPEEFGLQYDTASIEKRRVWDCQEAFLATFRTCRRVDKSAEAVAV